MNLRLIVFSFDSVWSGPKGAKPKKEKKKPLVLLSSVEHVETESRVQSHKAQSMRRAITSSDICVRLSYSRVFKSMA